MELDELGIRTHKIRNEKENAEIAQIADKLIILYVLIIGGGLCFSAGIFRAFVGAGAIAAFILVFICIGLFLGSLFLLLGLLLGIAALSSFLIAYAFSAGGALFLATGDIGSAVFAILSHVYLS